MQNSEFLNADELFAITGYKHIAAQKQWLDKNDWPYYTNAAGRPVVGRLFVRMMLSKTSASEIMTPACSESSITKSESRWKPDFSVLQ